MLHYKKGRQLFLLISLLCITLCAHAKLPTSVGLNQKPNPDKTTNGLSSSDWSSIKSQVKANKYKTYSENNGSYHSSNPAHGWQIHYAVDGTTTLTPRNRNTSTYHLGLKLNAIGYKIPGQTLEPLHSPQYISSQDNTLDYHWNDILTERWINSTTDLEQWFYLNQRPQGSGSGQPLTLQLSLDSNLTLTQENNSIHFTSQSGTTITYNKLKVWDANGHNLPAQMLLTGQQLSLLIDDSTASYPLTIDPSFQQQAYLKASNTGANDNFGVSVAISGDTVVVGAFHETSNATGVDGNQSDNSANGAGAAYVFIRNGNTWSQQAYLKASNTGANDNFGVSVAISGDTVVVGAFAETSNAIGVNGNQNDNSANDAGAAYVFTRNGNTWSQQAYLKASNTELEDRFGSAVVIAGDTVVIGALGEDSNASGVDGNQVNNSIASAGAAYVFIRSGNTWNQQAYLKASNSGENDFFGNSLAIDSNTLLVGASGEASNTSGVNGNSSDNSAENAGAAYVFTRNTNTWSQQAYLKASNTEINDQFGFSVAIASNTAVISANAEDSNATGIDGDQSDNSASIAGAAYVFTRSGNSWSQQAYLKAANTEAGDQFGFSVAIASDTVVIGALLESSNANVVDGDQSDNSANSAGAAYVFNRNGSSWSQQAYLKATNAEMNDNFGVSAAISGETIVIGAFSEASNTTEVNGNQSDNSANSAGAAYVFNLGSSSLMDVDSNGVIDALTDGLLIIRYLFGLTGDALTDNAVAGDCNRCDNTAIETYLDGLSILDVDTNGVTDALTDGLLIIRYQFGLTGDALTNNAVANNCNRCSNTEIESFLGGL
jgi:hypothetical protein